MLLNFKSPGSFNKPGPGGQARRSRVVAFPKTKCMFRT